MTKFTEMPEGSRRGWVAWAQSHDWGTPFAAWYDGMTGEMVTYSAEHNANGDWRDVEARHATPAAMKAWAGY